MAFLEKTTRVPAPLDDVWAFHSTADGLVRLTPSLANLQVEDIQRPEGATGNDLVEGSELRLSVGPLPFGPRQYWTSVITERVTPEAGDGEAFFVDEMRDGPMAEWRHKHLFAAAGDETVLTDRIDFQTPLGGIADRVVRQALRAGFAYRHRKTRETFGEDYP